MNPDLIASIQAFTLESRKLLERETEEQLQGLYGWLPDGSFGMGTATGLPEAAETRDLLERYVAEEKEAGLDAATARSKLKRETAFTWLNRAVAFRLMEERGIIKSTLAKQHKANAFIYYLTEVLGEGTLPASTPINPMGEGPVDTAYRKFILWQCQQLAADVSVLFDPATLASRLCPRPSELKRLAESTNAEALAEAWKPGNEETVGWVYQGFSSEELKAAFDAARESKKKFEPQDIPAVTQLFTIKWVVRFLVENTLGRLWMEMHPDSRLASVFEYLAPVANPQQRPLRQVKEITFLDPCCGSMHFGLLAFDLFVEMYREERANAGKPGWPRHPSAATEDEIPELILSHNLHGIDIDTRAIQLSALTLILRARTLNPKAQISSLNLASANVEQFTSGRLDEFVEKAKFSHPIYERVLRRLTSRLKDSEHLGSLLRIEREIQQLIDSERGLSANRLSELPGVHPEHFHTKEGVEKFFSNLKDQIISHLDQFTKDSQKDGANVSLFASEAEKGLRFLGLARQRYDVVVTNPPYLSGRKMNKRLATLMEQEFKEGKGDLYAAFIIRCQEFLSNDGLMGMLTMHSFMFIGSYEDLRARLRKEVAIETVGHYGGGLFAVGNPGTLQTAAFVLRRESDAARRESHIGTYFRLVKERDADAKRVAFESAIASLRGGVANHQVFHYKQSDFDAIEGKPWTYWMTDGLRGLFASYKLLGTVAKPRVGLQTGDNSRFLRKWWEVRNSKFHIGCSSSTEALEKNTRWFPYNKGGTPIAWHSKQQNVVNWSLDGAEIRSFGLETGKIRSRPQNTDFYFRGGVTWSLTSSKGFAARISPSGFIFDVNGMTCFPQEDQILTTLGLLNSRISQFLLSAINPTIAFQVGDIERLPIPSERSLNVDALVQQCIELTRQDSVENESNYVFVKPLDSLSQRANRQEKLAAIESQIDAEISRLYGLSEEDLAAIDRELNGLGETASDLDSDETEEVSDDDTEAEEISDLSPTDLARSWISYAIGTVLGRFEIGKPGGLGCGDFPETTVEEIRKLIDPDGIMPCEEGHPQDLASRVFVCLEWMLGAAEAIATVRTAFETDGEPIAALRGWMDRFTGQPKDSFWRYHHQLYRKRPIYWPFQSPEKKFTVWVFQEKVGPNTLHTLKQLSDEQLNLTERGIADLRLVPASKAAERELQKLLTKSDDLREFSKRLQAHIESGYVSCIDDGVVLNAAPLHDLFPSWPDTKKAWVELEAGEYEWAHQAMRYWPDRVTEACRTNRSLAIAHGLEHLCPPEPPKEVKTRGRKKSAKTENPLL